jgi:hypothetical protein
LPLLHDGAHLTAALAKELGQAHRRDSQRSLARACACDGLIVHRATERRVTEQPERTHRVDPF